MDGPSSFLTFMDSPPLFLKLMDGPFGRKKAIFEEKRRKNQLSETGPFRLILKLMDGPLSFFDIYGWPPSFLKLTDGPFGV